MADSVCFFLYEIHRSCDQYSVGRYSQSEVPRRPLPCAGLLFQNRLSRRGQVCERNRQTLRKILRTMMHLRQLTGNETQNIYGFGGHTQAHPGICSSSFGCADAAFAARRDSLSDLEKRLTADPNKRVSIMQNRALVGNEPLVHA